METLFVGRNIIFLPEVNSTNSYAITLLKNVNVAEGTVVNTANQTNGKGQRGSVWNTDVASNVTASVILKPVFLDLKKQFILYQIAALACYDLMAELLNSSQFDIKIKWPNDILVNEKKIAGILIENGVLNSRLNYSVIGIGININQVNFDQSINATSVKLLMSKDHKPDEILKQLCPHIEKYYLMLKNHKEARINEMYLDRFYKKDQWQDFEIGKEIKKMMVMGVGENGLLMLHDNDGKGKEFDVKEVKWIF